MNNYEYIIASLPVLKPQADQNAGLDAMALVAEIRAQLSERDARALDLLLSGWDPDKLDRAFYEAAENSRSACLKGYFRFDRQLRNAKADYLNAALSRPAGTDCLQLSEDEEPFEEREQIDAILSREDILSRERGLDEALWAKIDALTAFDWFSLDAILGFVARLQITHRWLKLDPQTGRALFRRLVEDIRRTRDGQNPTESN